MVAVVVKEAAVEGKCSGPRQVEVAVVEACYYCCSNVAVHRCALVDDVADIAGPSWWKCTIFVYGDC